MEVAKEEEEAVALTVDLEENTVKVVILVPELLAVEERVVVKEGAKAVEVTVQEV